MSFRDYTYGSKVLGEGYSSIVYKAKKQKSKHYFAVKILKQEFSKSEFQKKLLSNEIKVNQALKHHKNFVNLIQHGKHQKTYAFVMELCQKGSLADFLKKVNRLSQPQAIYIIKQVIQGYRLLNSLKIVHRDIKPGNILITQNNQIKLCDFGLAVNLNEKNEDQMFRIGTPCFMAPEVIKQNFYTEKADIWSIGITYFLMLTGQFPFKSQNYQKFFKQVTETNLKDIIPIGLSEFSKQFIIRTLNPKLNQRMTVQELFSFKFQSQIIQLKASLSQKQITLNCFKNKRKSLTNIKSMKAVDKMQDKKTLYEISLNTKGFNKLQTTQTTQGSSSQGKYQFEQKQEKFSYQKNQQKQFQKVCSTAQVSVTREKSPIKSPLRRFSKQQYNLVIKQMQKCTKILLNQIDFLRYIKKIIQLADKSLKEQFSQFKEMMKQYVSAKFYSLKNFCFVQNQKIKLFRNYPLFQAWVEILQEFQNVIKPTQKLNFKQFNFQRLLSSVILQIYLEFDKQIKTKLNANRLIVLDQLICLKDLLRMSKKGDSYFLKNSMLHQIVEGLTCRKIQVDKIESVFTGISKKLVRLDYS